jgi:hypothetical protein
MGEEQNEDKSNQDNNSQPPKRRRGPSVYANQINDFKNVSNHLSRTTQANPKKIGPLSQPILQKYLAFQPAQGQDDHWPAYCQMGEDYQ